MGGTILFSPPSPWPCNTAHGSEITLLLDSRLGNASSLLMLRMTEPGELVWSLRQ